MQENVSYNSSVDIEIRKGLDCLEIESQWRGVISEPVQTGHGDYAASYERVPGLLRGDREAEALR